MQSEPHSFGLQLAILVHEPKKLEKFGLVRTTDADSIVLDLNFEHGEASLAKEDLVFGNQKLFSRANVFAINFDEPTLLGKFQGIRLQI